MNNASFSNQSAYVTGWVGSPSGRGTIDILWSSILTIFLCTWTALCLNVPDRNDGKLQVFGRRLKWMFWAIVGPEIVLVAAVGQRASAIRSVKRFKSMGYPQWTARHGFFADMGGILLQPRESAPFLVDSRRLAYLVEKKYTPFPDISEADITDRSKVDGLSKALTIVQAGWLVFQAIGRAIKGIDITTLELSAAAIVLCTLGTFYCWLHKPSDVQKGIVLSINFSTAQILDEAGDVAAKPWTHTPLDFVAKPRPTCGYDVRRFFGLSVVPRERRLRRSPNDRLPDLSRLEKLGLFCISLAYTALHLAGWNFTFPTVAEQWLWRVSSSLMTGTLLFLWVYEVVGRSYRLGRTDRCLVRLKLKKGRPVQVEEENEDREVQEARKQEEEDRISATRRPGAVEATFVVCIVVIYLGARGYMLVEMLVALRCLPLGAFNTVEWADVIPHW